MNHEHLMLLLRGGGAAFTPLDLTDIYGYWDPTLDLYDSGGALTLWESQLDGPSSEQWDWKGSPGGSPTVDDDTLGGNVAITFSGAQGLQITTSTTPTTDTFIHPASGHVFGVSKVLVADNAADSLIAWQETGAGWELDAGGTANEFRARLFASSVAHGTITGASSDLIGAPFLWEYVFNATADTAQVNINGSSVGSVSNYTADHGNDGTNVLRLGTNTGNAQKIQAIMGPVVFCDAPVTGTELTNVRDWFADNWGIA